ncbi:hypothetical protein CR513_59957, partial [Mucuna pruriens]
MVLQYGIQSIEWMQDQCLGSSRTWPSSVEHYSYHWRSSWEVEFTFYESMHFMYRYTVCVESACVAKSAGEYVLPGQAYSKPDISDSHSYEPKPTQAPEGVSCGLFHDEAVGDTRRLHQDEGIPFLPRWSSKGLVVTS